MIILDTNVVSEFLRSSSEKQVEAWLSVQDGAMVYFTTVGEAELRYGVAILPAKKRRDLISDAIEGMLEEDFRDRILCGRHCTLPRHDVQHFASPVPISARSYHSSCDYPLAGRTARRCQYHHVVLLSNRMLKYVLVLFRT